MINNSSSDAQVFRVMASRIDAVRETMPVTGDPLRRAGTANLADGQNANRADVLRWAAAVRPACHAASALGIAARRLTLMERPRQPFDDPRVREYDSRVVSDTLATADTSLRETASCLRAGAPADSPASDCIQAASSRSTPSSPSSSSTTEPGPATPALPRDPTARGR